ncbi:MAG: Hemagglutinin/hemolysin-like protein, partial [Candidatus Adlerbacteria bacterium GW2011_GWC1_50_9]
DGFTDYPEDPGCESIVDPSENEPPVIALTGANPQVVTLGSAYTELGATADDAEDGQDIAVADIDSSAVNISAVGSYSVFYNFTDSDGAAAAEVIREVKVKTACSDGIDNDDDGNIDDEDAGCEGTQDNDENAKPEIELVGLSLVSVVAGDPYNEQGAVAHDEEDGDNPAVIGGDAVNRSIPGTYVVAYNYTDSDGVSANEVTRTVVVTAKPQCSDGEDNDEDGKTDSEDPACHTDGDAGNSGSYDPELNDEGDDPAPSPQCSDGVDNDGDGKIDYPADSGCSAASDNDESNPLFDCNDGGDNDNDGLIDMADPDCSDPSDDSESGSSGSGGGGGDSSSGSGGGGGGGGNGPIFNLTFPSSGGGGGGGGGSPGLVLGAAAEDNLPEGCSAYLWEYIHIGRKNNPEQVKKLQMFLNTEMGANLPITGFYGSLSYSWVEKFQVKYWEEVLKPWVPHGLPTEKTPTGYVYKTTRRWINMLNCPSLNLPIPPLP